MGVDWRRPLKKETWNNSVFMEELGSSVWLRIEFAAGMEGKEYVQKNKVEREVRHKS